LTEEQQEQSDRRGFLKKAGIAAGAIGAAGSGILGLSKVDFSNSEEVGKPLINETDGIDPQSHDNVPFERTDLADNSVLRNTFLGIEDDSVLESLVNQYIPEEDIKLDKVERESKEDEGRLEEDFFSDAYQKSHDAMTRQSDDQFYDALERQPGFRFYSPEKVAGLREDIPVGNKLDSYGDDIDQLNEIVNSAQKPEESAEVWSYVNESNVDNLFHDINESTKDGQDLFDMIDKYNSEENNKGKLPSRERFLNEGYFGTLSETEIDWLEGKINNAYEGSRTEFDALDEMLPSEDQILSNDWSGDGINNEFKIEHDRISPLESDPLVGELHNFYEEERGGAEEIDDYQIEFFKELQDVEAYEELDGGPLTGFEMIERFEQDLAKSNIADFGEPGVEIYPDSSNEMTDEALDIEYSEEGRLVDNLVRLSEEEGFKDNYDEFLDRIKNRKEFLAYGNLEKLPEVGGQDIIDEALDRVQYSERADIDSEKGIFAENYLDEDDNWKPVIPKYDEMTREYSDSLADPNHNTPEVEPYNIDRWSVRPEDIDGYDSTEWEANGYTNEPAIIPRNYREDDSGGSGGGGPGGGESGGGGVGGGERGGGGVE
jgi:hypothetical protein